MFLWIGLFGAASAILVICWWINRQRVALVPMTAKPRGYRRDMARLVDTCVTFQQVFANGAVADLPKTRVTKIRSQPQLILFAIAFEGDQRSVWTNGRGRPVERSWYARKAQSRAGQYNSRRH